MEDPQHRMTDAVAARARYFITENDEPEREVAMDEFIGYEQRAGFVSKFGPRHVATGGFSSHQGMTRLRGRVELGDDA